MILMTIPHLEMGVPLLVEMLRVKNSLSTLCSTRKFLFLIAGKKFFICQEVFDSIDVNKDGSIVFEEFLRVSIS